MDATSPRSRLSASDSQSFIPTDYPPDQTHDSPIVYDQCGETQARGKRRVSTNVRQLIVARRKAGTPIKQIATDFGLNRSTINDILRSEGVPARRATIGPEYREEIVRLYGEGLSIAQVAKRYRVSDDLMF